MRTYSENDKQYKRCRCLYCTGDCLCDECDYCSECSGHGCELTTSTNYLDRNEKPVTIESINGEKTAITFKHTTDFTNDGIKELFESAGLAEGISIDDLRLALTRSTKIITAYIDNKLVGLIRCMHDGFYSGTIDCLIVHKEYWNRGIGTALVKAMVEATKDIKNIRAVTSNSNSITLYAKCGFCEVVDGKLLQIMR